MTDLQTVRVVLTIAVEDAQDRQTKLEELQELAGAPPWVLSINVGVLGSPVGAEEEVVMIIECMHVGAARGTGDRCATCGRP